MIPPDAMAEHGIVAAAAPRPASNAAAAAVISI